MVGTTPMVACQWSGVGEDDAYLSFGPIICLGLPFVQQASLSWRVWPSPMARRVGRGRWLPQAVDGTVPLCWSSGERAGWLQRRMASRRTKGQYLSWSTEQHALEGRGIS